MTSAADIARGATIRPREAMLAKSDAVSARQTQVRGLDYSRLAVHAAEPPGRRDDWTGRLPSVINSASLSADVSARMASLSARHRSSAASTATSSRSSADTLLASALVSPASRSSQRASMAACSVARRDRSCSWEAAAHSRKARKAEAMDPPRLHRNASTPAVAAFDDLTHCGGRAPSSSSEREGRA